MRVSQSILVVVRPLLLVVALILSLSHAGPQTTGTGTLSGTVTDASGGRIADAKVTVTEGNTHLSRSTVTNGEGLYTLPALRSGTYQILVESRA